MSEQREITAVTTDQYDVVILGGGLAGLTLALQLKQARPTSSILVVERQAHPVPEAAYKVGESTVEIGTHYLWQVLGLAEHLRTQQLRKFGLRFFFSTADNQDIARRAELGLASPHLVPSYQLDRGRLENALGHEARQRGITFLDSCKVERVNLHADAGTHSCQLSQGEQRFAVRSRWVVDASGRSALLKRQLKLAQKTAHTANAVWFRIQQAIDVDEWSNDPAWHARITNGERYLSTNHLCGKGYWVWLIPLASGATSIGIVTDPTYHSFDECNRLERALAWLYAHEPQCARVVEHYLADVQDFRVMKNYPYSCRQVFSGERWCLTGEAGVFVDPLYSPGSDFIAMSNGLVSDLIVRELNGENIRGRAIAYNHVYLSLANAWFHIYEQQYGLLGNAQVMTAKYIWDTAVYWAIFSLLYFHNKLPALAEDRQLSATLLRVSQLSGRMQAFFREWDAMDQPAAANIFVDHYNSLAFMQQFHESMTASFTDKDFAQAFHHNAALLEKIAGQVISTVITDYSTNDQATIANQLQSWQADPLLAQAVTCYENGDTSDLAKPHWINFGYRSQRMAMATR